ARCRRRAGAGARAARCAIERVGVVRLTAAAAPAARRMGRAEVRPLAQVGLAEYDGAGGAQALGDERVARRDVRGEGERAGAGVHPVRRVDVVFYENWNSVERAAKLACLSLAVEARRDRRRVGVELDHGVDRRAFLIDRVDAGKILLNERRRAVAAALHARLEVVDRELLERKGGKLRRLARARRRFAATSGERKVTRRDGAGDGRTDERAASDGLVGVPLGFVRHGWSAVKGSATALRCAFRRSRARNYRHPARTPHPA